MARLTLSGRVYLDTNIFIYALEGYPVFRPVLTALFDALDRGELAAVTSELTLAEALVKPLLTGTPSGRPPTCKPCNHPPPYRSCP